MAILSGAVAAGQSIVDGETFIVGSGGVASGTVVAMGGLEIVTGRDSNVVIANGAEIGISSGATVSGANVVSGGIATVGGTLDVLSCQTGGGAMVSSGTACSSGKLKHSHVLKAMGVSDSLAASALRVSFGWNSTQADADAAIVAIAKLSARVPRKAA